MHTVLASIAVIGFTARSTFLAAQETTRLLVEPCKQRCELTLISDSEYGDDSGPGELLASGIRGWLDESGRMYIVGAPGTSVQVFGSDGAFLRKIGSGGSGSEELSDVSALVITEDGVFSVLDRGLGMILSFDWTGATLGRARPPPWFPLGLKAISVGDGLAIQHADIRTPDRVGYPLHLLNLESGEVGESFGSVTGEYDFRSGLNHVITGGPSGQSLWMAEMYTYRIELWEANQLL